MFKRLSAYALALTVHSLSLAMLVGGAYLLWATFPALKPGILAAAMLALAYAGRPRLGSAPEPRPGEEIPVLSAAAGRVARRLGLRPPTALLVATGFEAMAWRYGLRRRIALVLGHPLLSVLDRREIVALLASSLAPLAVEARGMRAVVQAARDSLERWCDVLRVDAFWPEPAALRGWRYEPGGIEPPPCPFLFGVAAFIANVALFLVSFIPRGALRALGALCSDDREEEELSDVLARDVAGAEALEALRAKMQLGPTLDVLVQRAVLRHEPVDAVGQLRLLALLDDTGGGRDCEGGPATEGLLSEEEFDAIQRALDARTEEVHSTLAERFRSALHPSR